MPTADRRSTPRTPLDKLAYIHIEPDNGAIVLNASGEGLGFHAMAPVERNGPLRFSVQEQNRKIALCGDLVWTDEIQKIGGVRFTTLTPEAHDQVLDWIRKSDGVSEERSTLGAALRKALPGIDTPKFSKSFKPALTWWNSGKRVKLKVSGFARGLAAGFLLSLVVCAVALFSYGHRREFGESLIRLGERLTGARDSGAAAIRTMPSVVAASVSSVVTTPPVSTAVEKSRATLAKTAVTNDLPHAVEKQPAPTAVPVRQPVPVPLAANAMQVTADPVSSREGSSPGAKAPSSVTTQRVPIAATVANSAPSLAAIKTPLAPSASAGQLLASLHSQPLLPRTVALAPQSANSEVQMFFEIGRFKKEDLAQSLSDKIAQLGIHASVVPKNHLWMSSYQVLAGPYDDQGAETHLRDELVSHGYKPRPYERGSRDFTFRTQLTIDGSELPTGDFTITWESYIADAKVKFKQGGYLLAEADGRWTTQTKRFANNEYVYLARPGGTRPLLEVHFAGMDRALVFRRLR